MPVLLKININRGASVVTFSPTPLAAQTRDQIFWTNNDPSEPHWPGLKNADGSINPTYFMPNQIAQGGDSSGIYSSAQALTLNYVCSLHPHSASEQGIINITNAPA